MEKPSPGLKRLLEAVHKQIRDEERESMAAKADNDAESEVDRVSRRLRERTEGLKEFHL